MSITPTSDPLDLFHAWFDAAKEREPAEPNAVALATVAPDGHPSLRMVLLKGADARGFVFYTNYESRKGRELLAMQRAALCFYWKSMKRQVRIEGPAAPVEAEEADAYFASRPKQAQIGAWASKQSAPLESRLVFEKTVADYAAKYAIGWVPRPPHWSGYRIVPLSIEFWQERPFRLHDRIAFTRDQPGAGWNKTRLYP